MESPHNNITILIFIEIRETQETFSFTRFSYFSFKFWFYLFLLYFYLSSALQKPSSLFDNSKKCAAMLNNRWRSMIFSRDYQNRKMKMMIVVMMIQMMNILKMMKIYSGKWIDKMKEETKRVDFNVDFFVLFFDGTNCDLF